MVAIFIILFLLLTDMFTVVQVIQALHNGLQKEFSGDYDDGEFGDEKPLVARFDPAVATMHRCPLIPAGEPLV